jgi:hypothetical protein
VSAKRACPLADHAISASGDGVPLLERYERDYGEKITNKKQRFCLFMQESFQVGRLGQPPSFKVSLYRESGASSLEPTSQNGTKDHFMGFETV